MKRQLRKSRFRNAFSMEKLNISVPQSLKDFLKNENARIVRDFIQKWQLLQLLLLLWLLLLVATATGYCYWLVPTFTGYWLWLLLIPASGYCYWHWLLATELPLSRLYSRLPSSQPPFCQLLSSQLPYSAVLLPLNSQLLYSQLLYWVGKSSYIWSFPTKLP